MNSAICTLFEGHYHYGVAVLANSLYRNGFRGSLYAGYRGELPPWAKNEELQEMQWSNGKTLKVKDDFSIHFIPLTTDYHLTNYKPDFMLDLWNGPAADAERMFYFDPDIVVSAPWFFFEKWVTCGIALCEDVNSPLSKNHPTRSAWRNYFSKNGIFLYFKDIIYVNGGFAGVSLDERGFLETWKLVQEAMAPAIGGLNRSAFINGSQLPEGAQGPFAPFGKTDQDALNATIEAWDGEYSFITQEGMGFRSGLAILPHALGQPKPWKWNIFKQSLSGRRPRLVDREYWKYADGPLKPHSLKHIRAKRRRLIIAAVVGRFYKL